MQATVLETLAQLNLSQHITAAQATAIAAATRLILDGHVLKATTTRKPKPIAVVEVDTATMTDRELFAYYKRTALTADLAFFLRFEMSAALRARAEAIAKPTKHDVNALNDALSMERIQAERAADVPALATGPWGDSIGNVETAAA